MTHSCSASQETCPSSRSTLSPLEWQWSGVPDYDHTLSAEPQAISLLQMYSPPANSLPVEDKAAQISTNEDADDDVAVVIHRQPIPSSALLSCPSTLHTHISKLTA